MKMYLFGFILLGKQVISIEYESPKMQIRDRGRGELIAKWDHLIRIEKLDEGKPLYIDEIDIEAGIWTPAVFLFAHFFWPQASLAGARMLPETSFYLDRCLGSD